MCPIRDCVTTPANASMARRQFLSSRSFISSTYSFGMSFKMDRGSRKKSPASRSFSPFATCEFVNREEGGSGGERMEERPGNECGRHAGPVLIAGRDILPPSSLQLLQTLQSV